MMTLFTLPRISESSEICESDSQLVLRKRSKAKQSEAKRSEDGERELGGSS